MAAERTALLRGPRLRLRPLEAADAEVLAGIGAQPEVSRWWPGITAEGILRRLVVTARRRLRSGRRAARSG